MIVSEIAGEGYTQTDIHKQIYTNRYAHNQPGDLIKSFFFI